MMKALRTIAFAAFLLPLSAAAIPSSTTAQPNPTAVALFIAETPFSNAKPTHGGTFQLRSESTDFRTMATQTAKSCLYFFGALLVLASVVKRFKKQPAAPEGQISIVSRAVLGPKSSLLLASVRGKEFFLSLSGDDIALVAAHDAEEDAEDAEEEFDEYYEDEEIESKYRRS